MQMIQKRYGPMAEGIREALPSLEDGRDQTRRALEWPGAWPGLEVPVG